MKIELFEKVHSDLVSEYLKDNPGSTEDDAFLKTKDKAWEITVGLIEKKIDSINKKLDDASKRDPLSSDKLLNDAINKQSNKALIHNPDRKY